MPTYEFTIVLADPRAFDDDALLDFADRVFPDFGGDVTPAVSSGDALVECTMAAPSLEDAIHAVIHVLNREGVAPRRVEVETASLPAA